MESIGIMGLLLFFLIYFIFYLSAHWVFIAACSLSLAVESRGCPLVVVHSLLTVAASLIMEHGLWGRPAQLPCGLWDLPRPGIEPVSPALQGRFLTTGPPGKARLFLFIYIYVCMSEKVMAPHSSTLAWKIAWTEEPSRLQSMGSRRVGQD